MQALVERSDYQIIELQEPSETGSASEEEDQITELAKKIFSDVCPRLSERITQYKMDITTYKLEEIDLKNTWRYWVLESPCMVRITELAIGALLASSGLSFAVLKFSTNYGAVVGAPMTIVGMLLAVDGCQDSTLRHLIGKSAREKLYSLRTQMEVASSNKEYAEKVVHFTNTFAEFLDSWETFQTKPDVTMLEEVFLALNAVAKADKDLIIPENNKLDEFGIAYKDFIQKGENFLPFNIIKLFLMEEACAFLKEDSVGKDWEKLKNSLSSNFLWLDKNAEPWRSLNLENPDKEAYLYFFEHQAEYKSLIVAQKIKAIFLDKAKLL
jgi:hypothetical protein